jgi:hypothetical protein
MPLDDQSAPPSPAEAQAQAQPQAQPQAQAQASSQVPGRLVTFYRLLDAARLPLRADRSAAGSLPTRAFRYCDAVTTATGFGWYLFPPMDFDLYFDGNEVFATWAGVEGWFPLAIIQYPDFPARFDAAAPEGVKGFAPPFLGCMQEPGIIQVWTGLAARTLPEWSVLIRPCANMPPGRGFEAFEGIVETDHWFGPLFSNLRLTRTHSPVQFRRDWPIAMLQVIPRIAYAEETLRSAGEVASLEAFTAADWQAYADTVVRRCTQPVRNLGAYAVENRKRRKAPDQAQARVKAQCPYPGSAVQG